MEATDKRPTVWDIRGCLLSSVDFAKDYALHRPEHAPAMTSFVEEIERIKKELLSSFEESSFPSSLPDILNGLIGASAIASIMAERHPERSGALNSFVEDLKDVQQEFIRKVRPEVNPLA